jgi:class 3 adenylate cyclase/GAF domain-containing protein
LFEAYQEALANAAIAKPYLASAIGLIFVPVFYFYDSLIQLAVYSEPKNQQKSILKAVAANQKKLKKWADSGPMNYRHKFYLVEAERYRVLGQEYQAMKCYDRAIALAQENEYIQEVALAYELAAKFYLSIGQEITGKAYIQEASYAYQLWGATAKVSDLHQRYGKFFTATQPRVNDPIPMAFSRGVRGDRTSSTMATTSGSTNRLDMATVMKASQAISGEIVLDKLLASLMKITIENAGAQRGYLILSRQGNLMVEAAGGIDQEIVTVLQPIPVGECEQMAQAIVNYVARTQETVVLNNATQAGNFTNDPYIKEFQPLSILCVPLINQNKLISIIYLENNLTSGAFTPERVEILQLLSGQVAIAIENAKLYAEVRENESRLAQFLDAMPVGVGILDASGNPCYTNRVARELLGKGVVPDATSGQIAEVYRLYKAGTGKEYPPGELPIVRAFKGEKATANDIEIHLPGDRIIPVESFAKPVYDEQGKIVYAITSFQDITERKKAEADRERFTNELYQLNQAYERFVPRQFLQFLEKDSIVHVELGDQVQLEMSVLFSDIRDFTTISESLTPEENFRFINSYLSRMEPAIIENNGFIDKYIGDAIMALFGGEADNAVKAAISMLHRLTEYNQHRANCNYMAIRNGIGINTGLLMLGTVGGKSRMDSTVISDAVNLASRVESLTKNYGLSLLITEQTYSRLKHRESYHIRKIDRVQVKGKSELVTVYEVFDADMPEVKEGKFATLETFSEALSLYNEQQFYAAAQLFDECCRQNPGDRVAQIYFERCQKML